MRRLLALAALFLLVSLAGIPPRAAIRTVVAIQPLGQVDPWYLEVAKKGIGGVYDVDVRVLPARDLPSEAYTRPRQRYRAEKLLDYLLGLPQGSADKVVGLTQQDISTTTRGRQDWGIFGLGLLSGRVCVVSTFRLHKGSAPEALFEARLVKVLNHELGHTFGIGHCPSRDCLMEDAGGTIRTLDSESGEFCAACRARLGTLLR